MAAFHQGLPDITEISIPELKTLLKTHFSFLFTRHPFERVVLVYGDKLYSSKDEYLQRKYNKIIYNLYRNEIFRIHSICFIRMEKWLSVPAQFRLETCDRVLRSLLAKSHRHWKTRNYNPR